MPFTQTGCAPIRQKPLPAVLLDSLSQRDVRAACAPRILACASEEPLPTGRRPQARNMDKSAGSCRSPPAPRPPRRGRSGPDGPWRPCIGRTALPISVAAAAVKRADGGRLAGRCGCHGRSPRGRRRRLPRRHALASFPGARSQWSSGQERSGAASIGGRKSSPDYAARRAWPWERLGPLRPHSRSALPLELRRSGAASLGGADRPPNMPIMPGPASGAWGPPRAPRRLGAGPRALSCFERGKRQLAPALPGGQCPQAATRFPQGHPQFVSSRLSGCGSSCASLLNRT